MNSGRLEADQQYPNRVNAEELVCCKFTPHAEQYPHGPFLLNALLNCHQHNIIKHCFGKTFGKLENDGYFVTTPFPQLGLAADRPRPLPVTRKMHRIPQLYYWAALKRSARGKAMAAHGEHVSAVHRLPLHGMEGLQQGLHLKRRLYQGQFECV